MNACQACGAFVFDVEQHGRFHDALVEALTGLLEQVGKLTDGTAGEEATHAHDRG